MVAINVDTKTRMYKMLLETAATAPVGSTELCSLDDREIAEFLLHRG